MGHLRQKKVGGNYYYTFYFNGRKYERSLKTKDKKKAKLLAAKIDVGLAEGTLSPGSSKSGKSKITLGDFVAEYQEKFLDPNPKDLAKNTIQSYHYNAKYLMDIFGSDKILSQITPEDVERIALPKLASKSPNTRRGMMTIFHAILKTAVDWGYINTNPIKGKIPAPKKKLPVMFKDEEQARIIEYFQNNDVLPHHRAYFLLLLGTGLRMSEGLNLKWDQVFWEQKRLVFWSKGRERGVPLSDSVLRVLRDVQSRIQLTSPQVFPEWQSYQGPEAAWRKHKAKIGVKYTIHNFRSNYASRYIQNGGKIPALMTIMGWENYEVAKRYLAFSPDILEDERNRAGIEF